MKTLIKYSGIYQYSFRNSLDNKKYIGSSINLYKRHNDHLYSLRAGTHSNKHFQNAFNIYGLENLEYNILEYIDNNQLIKKEITSLQFRKKVFDIEQIYLDKYFAQEYIKNIKDKRFFKLLYNKSVIANCNYELNIKAKEVHMYSKEGLYLDSFLNSHIAEICTSIDSAIIRRCCHKEYSSGGGFLWSFKKLSNIPPYFTSRNFPIYQYDSNKVLIKKWNSLKDAKIVFKIRKRRSKKSRQPVLQKGFYWLYEGESFPEYKRRILTKIERKLFKEDILNNISILSNYGTLTKFIKRISVKYNLTISSTYNYYYKIKKERYEREKNDKNPEEGS